MAGAADVGQVADPVMQPIVQETDISFWKETGYKPGHRLEYPEDAYMMPVWLTILYAVVMRHLEAYRFRVPSDPAALQRLTAYQQQLVALFAADPSLDQRAQDVMHRIRSYRRQ
jgi:hypothetical protein